MACSRLSEYTSPEAKLRCSPGGPLSPVPWAMFPFKSNFSCACLLISSAYQVRDTHTETYYLEKQVKQMHTNEPTRIHTALYLADEPGDEQKDQNTVVISAVTEEGVRHEGGEE